jgi:cytochrome c oxidase cbb3-type subunit 3
MKVLFPSWIRVSLLFIILIGLFELLFGSGTKIVFLEKPIILLFLILFFLLIIAFELVLGCIRAILDQSGIKGVSSNHKKIKAYLDPKWAYSSIIGIICFGSFFGGDYFFDSNYSLKKIIENHQKNNFSNIEILTSLNDLENGRNIYETNCSVCHANDGGGGIGPNFTDSYWIQGGGIKNIVKTITLGGREGKGMIAWNEILTPLEISQVASYIVRFEGNNSVKPKAAEGALWTN